MLLTSARCLVLLAVFLAAGCAQSPTPDEEPDPRAEDMATLRRYIGRDLWAQDVDLHLLERTLRQLDPARPEIDPFIPMQKRPHQFWAFGREGQPAGLLVLDVQAGKEKPGTTKLRLTAFDEGGGVRARADFTTGHRRYFTSARLQPSADGAEPAVVIEFQVNIGPFFGTYYYALIGDRFDLVRVTDIQYMPHRRDY